MKTLCSFALALLSGLSLQAGDLKWPESAVYDPVTRSTFISNYRGDCVTKIDAKGNRSVLADGIHQPLGMLRKDRTFYVISNPKKVVGLGLPGGQVVFSIEIPEAIFLNDLTIDQAGNLYATDTRGGAIFRINPADRTYAVFCQTGLTSLNGIVFDARNNRLIFCTFKQHAQIVEVRLADRAVSVLVDGGFDNLDGIAMDEAGNFYFSSWGPGSFADGFHPDGGAIYKFDNHFAQPREVVARGLNSPADIFYNSATHELVLPLALANRIAYLKLEAGEAPILRQ